MLNRYFFTLLIIIFISFSLSASNDVLREAELALDYIESDAVQTENFAELDRLAIEKALNNIDIALDSYNFSLQPLLKIHRAYLTAIYKLNIARQEAGEAIDIESLEYELARLESILENNPNSKNASNIFYSAGHLSLYLLEDPRLADKYWTICANSGHAGCMNILASNYYSGDGGTPQDFQKSLAWHKKTYETGLNFKCAGIYSAAEISTMLFLFPSISNTENWADWANKSSALLTKLEQKQQTSDEILCRKGEYMINRYIFGLADGNDDKSLLEEAKLNLDIDYNEPAYIEAYKIIGQHDFPEKTISLLEQVIDEQYRCDIGLTHIMYARVLGQRKLAEDIVASFSHLDTLTCETVRTTYHLLQNKGAW